MAGNATRRNARVWFVTGASSGFGRAVSSAALGRGDRVVATGRDLAAMGALTSQAPERALALRLDVTDAAAARNAMEQAVARFGGVDVVFNNAGYGHVGAIEELRDDELRRQLEVNLLGVVNITRAALPHMRRQRSGHILQMSSLNGVEGLPGAAYYAASKFAIEGFSESLAAEVAHLGIRVTIVEPAPFRTRFLADRSAKWAKPMPDYAASAGRTRELLRQMDGRQPGDPERAADAIIQAVEAEPPPSRLPLGRMAVDHIRAKLQARLGELEAWSRLGASTDFPADEDLVLRAYSAFNRRDIDAGLGLMDPDVEWPDAADGGHLRGQEQVRRHWREQFSRVDPRIDVADVRQTGGGRVEARVRQIVRDREGGVLADDPLVHVFTVDNDRIKRMDVISPAFRRRT